MMKMLRIFFQDEDEFSGSFHLDKCLIFFSKPQNMVILGVIQYNKGTYCERA